jgi:hypothetical protein
MNVSDPITTIKIAAMNAAKATSSTAVPRRSFMPRIKKKCSLVSMMVRTNAYQAAINQSEAPHTLAADQSSQSEPTCALAAEGIAASARN